MPSVKRVGSARGPKMALGRITLLGAVVVSALFAACGNKNEHGALVTSVDGNQPGGINCTGMGCPCTSEGATAACGEKQATNGDNVVCAEGKRTCRAGVWGTCEIQRRVTKYVPHSDKQLLNLADTAVSCGDVCDPYCNVFVDTPPGIDPGPDLTVNGGGLTLPGRAGGGSCSNVVVTPSTSTITVTSLRPTLVTEPASLSFRATCGAGGPQIQPSWVIGASDYDVARIDTRGVLRVLSGVAKTVQVTGATAFGRDTASVNIVVNVDQVDAACDETWFDVAPSGTEPGKTLYPYAVEARPVVFPLGLNGPLVQWSTGGVDADCVKVSLDYPRGPGAKTFHWSRIVAGTGGDDPRLGSVDTSQPAAPVSDDAWRAFGQAAAGNVGEIKVQRHRTGAANALPAMPPIPVEFASDSVRGTAYFTQYLRRFRDDANRGDDAICEGDENGNQPDINVNDARYRTSVQNGCVNGDCSPNVGPACPVGNCTQAKTTQTLVATLQSLDLANPTQGLSAPFAGLTATRCVVCHSISADGTTLVASDYSLSGISTIAKLDSSSGRAQATSIADSPTYSWTNNGGDPISPEFEQSKGFSYAAISPNGRYVLQGPNFWGNTRFDTPLGAGGTQDASYEGGGKRFFLLDVNHYRAKVRVATAAPLPGHTRNGDSLTGVGVGVLRVDGVELARGDDVLVQNESDPLDNGIYVVEDSGPTRAFRLVLRGDQGGGTTLAFGDKFLVSEGDRNGGKYFHIAEPTGTVDLGTTPITFAPYTTVTAATSRPLPAYTAGIDADGVPYLTGSGTMDPSWIDGARPDSWMSILVKDEAGANARYNGIYSVLDAFSDPWQLVRRSEADTDPEVSRGMRVRVSQGNAFGGKTFVLSNAGAVTLGVTPLTFEVDTLLDEGTKYDRGGVASALPTMMFPVFSPDGNALVYVNGDADTAGTSAAATGWRRGLSLLSFNATNATRPFSNKRRLLNNYGAAQDGKIIKSPFFEPDSRSVVFVEGSSDEFCPIEAYRGHCTGPDCSASTEGVAIDSDVERACFRRNDQDELGHGNGAPVARGFWPGRLQSIHADTATKTDLSFLNGGLASQDQLAFAADDGKAYQPNVLPFTAGGFRWVVFTSTRAYGNQLNALGTHFTCAAPLLWMAAIDDTPAGASDRSHPAFLLPGQNLRSFLSDTTRTPYGRHYMNERGYVVPNSCKAEHTRCTLDTECCGGTGANPTMQCRLNTMTDPASRSCEAADSCVVTGDACTTDAQCCNGLCVANVCSTLPQHTAAVFTRVFDSNCPPGYKVRWGNFEWHADAPSSTSIEFRASVSDSATSFGAESLRIATADADHSNPPPAAVSIVNVGQSLLDAEIVSGPFLRIQMTFTPSADGLTAPVLYDWNQRYDCLAAE